MNPATLPLDIVELNTMSDPRTRWRDETPRIRCAGCGHYFLLGRGIDYVPEINAITRKHMEMCKGDAAVALMNVEQAWKAGWRP